MKFRKLNLPENYQVTGEGHSLSGFDTEMPTGFALDTRFQYKQVFRVSALLQTGGPGVTYWEADQNFGDVIPMPSVEAALCHVEAMAGMGMLGHGYKKGMLNENT